MNDELELILGKPVKKYQVVVHKDGIGALRNRWISKPAWKFTEDKATLLSMIPKYV